MEPFPAAPCRGAHVVRSAGLRTGSGTSPPVALCHRRGRHFRPAADGWRRSGRLDQFPFLSVDRERVHEHCRHDATGHAGGSDVGGHWEVRVRRRAASRQVAGRDRHGLLQARGDGHWRAALTVDGRPAGRHRPFGWRGRPPRRGHHRARAGGVASVLQRAARRDVAGGDRSGSRGGRDRARHLASGPGRGPGRATVRTRSGATAGRGRAHQGAPAHVWRRLCDLRFTPYRQGRDAAGHPPAGGDPRAYAAGPGQPGPSGVLRRGGAADPARAGGHTRHGALSPP